MKHTASICIAGLMLLGACAAAPEPALEAAQASDPAATDVAALALLMSELTGESPPTTDEIAAIAEAASIHPLGSEENPVRASGAAGQRAYLSRLNCPAGGKPAFHRLGSVGIGIYGYIMDIYALQCPGGAEFTAYMDLYHSGYQEAQPLPDFTIDPPF